MPRFALLDDSDVVVNIVALGDAKDFTQVVRSIPHPEEPDTFILVESETDAHHFHHGSVRLVPAPLGARPGQAFIGGHFVSPPKTPIEEAARLFAKSEG